MQKKLLAVLLAKFYLRHNRGLELTSFIVNAVKMIVYFGGLWYLVKEWFNIDFSKWIAIGLAFGYIVICYLIGFLDEKIGFWKIQNIYNSRELNPFIREMAKNIEDIKNNGGGK